MTINTNRLVLALAITVLSCTASMMANMRSMTQALSELYEEEEQHLLQIQDSYFREAEGGHKDIEALAEEAKRIVGYPILICKKYMRLLSHGLAWVRHDSLISEYNERIKESTLPSLEKTYLSQMLAAIYFDHLDIDETYINTAQTFASKTSDSNSQHTVAINNYIKARIYAELVKDDLRKEANFASCLSAAEKANQPFGSAAFSKVLVSLLDELAENYSN